MTDKIKIEVRENAIRRMEYEMEDLVVRHSVQENLGRKEQMEKLEKDMENLQKSITLVENQIKDLKK